MTEYKCGHVTDGTVILDENPLSIAEYLGWAESVGVFGTREKCIDCDERDRFARVGGDQPQKGVNK